MARREKKTVNLRGIVLGEGMPKICIPVMGRNVYALAEAAKRACAAQADLIELRIDSLSPMPCIQDALEACRAVREAAPDTALLFTMRTRRDGGPGDSDAEAYEALLCAVCSAHAADAVDCELSAGEAVFKRIVSAAHASDMAVVGSSHEFGEIGDMNRAQYWLEEQARLGADVCKAAVMTHSRTQALEAACVMTRAGEAMEQPVIGIAMGPAGVITRIGAECMGSCLTFGTAGEASAPGQIDAQTLRASLQTVHMACKK